MVLPLARIAVLACFLCCLAPVEALGFGCGSALRDCSLREAAQEKGLCIGAAVQEPLVASGNEPYLDAVVTHYGSITTENAMKWRFLAEGLDAYDFRIADATVEFAEDHELRIRGHALVWYTNAPSFVRAAVEEDPDPARRLLEILDDHITAVMGRYAGRVAQWDVVNEPLQGRAGNFFERTLGLAYIPAAFEMARAADPEALLFLNEAGVFQESPERFDELYDLLRDLVRDGVPVDGVGLQAHFVFGQKLADRRVWERRLRRLAALGLQIEISELSVSESDHPEPGRVLADIASACAAVSACTGITFWGVDDGHQFWNSRPGVNAAILDASYAPKPAYEALRDRLARLSSRRSGPRCGASLGRLQGGRVVSRPESPSCRLARR